MLENNKIKTGIFGEDLALDYLTQNNYTILEKNWRYKRLEVDIICNKEDILFFVEVKTRVHKKSFVDAVLAVTYKKIENLKLAAEAYLHEYPKWQRIQFNIIAINIDFKSQVKTLKMIEDIF